MLHALSSENNNMKVESLLNPDLSYIPSNFKNPNGRSIFINAMNFYDMLSEKPEREEFIRNLMFLIENSRVPENNFSVAAIIVNTIIKN